MTNKNDDDDSKNEKKVQPQYWLNIKVKQNIYNFQSKENTRDTIKHKNNSLTPTTADTCSRIQRCPWLELVVGGIQCLLP